VPKGSAAVGADHGQPDAVQSRVRLRGAGGLGVEVRGDDGRGAKACRGEGEEAGAGAEVQDSAEGSRISQFLEGAEAQTRRLVRPGPERAAGIDEEKVRRGGRRVPGRGHCEPPDLKGSEALTDASDPVHIGDGHRPDLRTLDAPHQRLEIGRPREECDECHRAVGARPHLDARRPGLPE
jgi:hypothetical protein